MNINRLIGAGSIGLGIGISAAAVLGPLGLKVIRFRLSESLNTQFAGGEMASLTLVAPVAIAAGVLWIRGHHLAAPLTMGPALYAIYTYTTVIFGQEYRRFDGNVEQYLPLYAGLLITGIALATAAWKHLIVANVPQTWRFTSGALLATIGIFFGLAWAAQIRLVAIGKPSQEYLDGPALFWLIKGLDYGVAIPAFLLTGYGLFRSHPLAVRIAPALCMFATSIVASVAGMAIQMQRTGDPSAEPVMIVVTIPATLVLATISITLLHYVTDKTEAAKGVHSIFRTALAHAR